jgi:hypothetical protein
MISRAKRASNYATGESNPPPLSTMAVLTSEGLDPRTLPSAKTVLVAVPGVQQRSVCDNGKA